METNNKTTCNGFQLVENRSTADGMVISDTISSDIYRAKIGPSERATMLQNYRIFVDQYNKSVDTLNKSVDQYNKSVAEFVETNQLQVHAKTAFDNFEDTTHQGNHIKWLSTKEYNNLVEDKNGNMLLLKKRKYMKLKQPQERIFEVILWIYSEQINSLTTHLESLSSDLKISYQKARVTSTQIAHLKKEGIPRILYTDRTIRNHIYRLRDTGVIYNYSFHGTKKPVKFHISNKILVLSDQKTSVSENQYVNSFLRKKFPNKDEVTCSIFKENIKKEGNVDNHSFAKGQKSTIFDISNIASNGSNDMSLHKNTLPDRPKKNDPVKQGQKTSGGGKNLLSEHLREQILDRHDMVEALTNGTYSNYVFHATNNRKRYESEANNGAMAREEFRILLLQQFIKIAAPIWKNHAVFAGSWMLAYQAIFDEFLLNSNGSIPSKLTLMVEFDCLLYRINRSKRFFRKKKDYPIHYPSIYFDPTRKLAKEGGFAYTLKWLKVSQKRKSNLENRKAKRIAEAGKRRKTLNADEKVRKLIKEYLKGGISLPTVFEKIETNPSIPNYFIGEVPRLLELLNAKHHNLY